LSGIDLEDEGMQQLKHSCDEADLTVLWMRAFPVVERWGGFNVDLMTAGHCLGVSYHLLVDELMENCGTSTPNQPIPYW